MRWVVVLFALSGCNQVLGIDKTILVDARQFDAPTDAPYACPAIGTAPQFSRGLHQVSTRNCTSYTANTAVNRTIAYCQDAVGTGIAEGTVDRDDLQQTTGIAMGNAVIDSPRLTPEGDEVYVRSITAAGPRISIYRRTATAWTWQVDLSIVVGSFDQLQAVTSGPVRRVFLFSAAAGLRESVSDGGGGWTEVGTYAPADLGLVSFSDPRISGDGLRMVLTGARAGDPSSLLLYADRPDVASRFRTAMFLFDAPNVSGASLADDCSRLYFSALNSVFYVRQN